MPALPILRDISTVVKIPTSTVQVFPTLVYPFCELLPQHFLLALWTQIWVCRPNYVRPAMLWSQADDFLEKRHALALLLVLRTRLNFTPICVVAGEEIEVLLFAHLDE